MGEDFVKIVQLVSPIVTPILILWLGLKINKTLEATKASLAKEKESKQHCAMYNVCVLFGRALLRIWYCLVGYFIGLLVVATRKVGSVRRYNTTILLLLMFRKSLSVVISVCCEVGKIVASLGYG